MKIFIVDQSGDLARYRGKSIVVEFKNGRPLELAESESPPARSSPRRYSYLGRQSTFTGNS